MQCISYDKSPKERCSRISASKFCDFHRSRLTTYTDEDPIDVSIETKSTTNLLRLYARTQSAIEARQTFTEMMVAEECRDFGHLKRIRLLFERLEAIEKTIASRASAPEETEVAEPDRVPTLPALRKRTLRSRRIVESWRQAIAEAEATVHKEFAELEAIASGVTECYGVGVEVLYALGDLRMRLGGSAGRSTRLVKPGSIPKLHKWTPLVDMYTYAPPQTSFERFRRLNLGLLEMSATTQEYLSADKSQIRKQLWMAQAILAAEVVMLGATASREGYRVMVFPMVRSGPIGLPHFLEASNSPFHRNLSMEMLFPVDDLPGLSYLDGIAHARGKSLEETRSLNNRLAHRISKKAYVLASLGKDPIPIARQEVSTYLAIDRGEGADRT